MIVLAMVAVMNVLASKLFTPANPRSVWLRPRSSQWWEDVIMKSFDHNVWMENFRMSRETFQYLCQQLRLIVEKQNARLRQCVSTEHRVAITLSFSYIC